ncbi:unnamed protein product [Dicrocoelium dendriticum]|nr:unnamed protein product [Dicrocoelium dendriticum]
MHFHSDSQGSMNANLEGHIQDQNIGHLYNESLVLLNEPIRATMIKSLKAVGKKFNHVLFPRKGQELLKEWDLWGPLTLCLVMSVLLHSSPSDTSLGDGGPEFAQVFIIFWLGAALVTLNSKLLGGAVTLADVWIQGRQDVKSTILYPVARWTADQHLHSSNQVLHERKGHKGASAQMTLPSHLN